MLGSYVGTWNAVLIHETILCIYDSKAECGIYQIPLITSGDIDPQPKII